MTDESNVNVLAAEPTDYKRAYDLTRITEAANVPQDAFMLLSSASTDYGVQLSLIMDLIFPIGVAVPWHGDTPPAGFVIYDGSQFDADTNPKNALAFPSGRFPNYSGRVPEGYIDDANGAVGSEQEGGVISHGHSGSFTGKAKAPTATFKGNALPTHAHQIPSESSSMDNDGALGDSGDDEKTTGHINTSGASAGTPSGTVTVNSYTPEGSISVSSTGSERNTVDRIICHWIGRLG